MRASTILTYNEKRPAVTRAVEMRDFCKKLNALFRLFVLLRLFLFLCLGFAVLIAFLLFGTAGTSKTGSREGRDDCRYGEESDHFHWALLLCFYHWQTSAMPGLDYSREFSEVSP